MRKSSEGLLLLDKSLYIKTGNTAAEKLLRQSLDSLMGKHIQELLPPEYTANSITKAFKLVFENLVVFYQPLQLPEIGGIVILYHAPEGSETDNSKQDCQQAAGNLGNLTEDNELGQESSDLAGYVVKSPVMIKVIQNIRRIALFDSTVLLTGETGTGKGALASLLHRLSPRKTGEFVHVNCGAIPEHLMESEFFGYMPGSFTGANKGGKKGLVELAQGGILFLDEVDCLPLNLQAKLLHLIQEREFMPVGGIKKVNVDVRFAAATNKDLLKLIEEGHFREDLYYRLNVVPIVIPPLRERKEEILPLALCFLDRLCQRYGVEREFSTSAVKVLLNYQWPGNVRELENVIERCAVTSASSCITADLLQEYLQEPRVKAPPSQTSAKAAVSSNLNIKVEKLEKAVLEDALRKYGSTRKAAAHLGINQSTVVRKMKKYGITSGTAET